MTSPTTYPAATPAPLDPPARQRRPGKAARQAAAAEADEVARRCLVTGEIRPKPELVRLVVGPDGRIVPDVAERLPGRGLWLTARRDIVATAVAKRLFTRAARAPVIADEQLADQIEALLAGRCGDLLGLARRAGRAFTGFMKVRSLAAAGEVAVLVEASDGGADARGKLEALSRGVPLVDVLTNAELSAAFGREHVVHAALTPGRLAAAFRTDAARLRGFRTEAESLRIGKGRAPLSRTTNDGAGAQ